MSVILSGSGVVSISIIFSISGFKSPASVRFRNLHERVLWAFPWKGNRNGHHFADTDLSPYLSSTRSNSQKTESASERFNTKDLHINRYVPDDLYHLSSRPLIASTNTRNCEVKLDCYWTPDCPSIPRTLAQLHPGSFLNDRIEIIRPQSTAGFGRSGDESGFQETPEKTPLSVWPTWSA